MSEDFYSNENVAGSGDQTEERLPPVAPAIDEEALQKITREAIEKAVREIVPGLAEKIIREEIRRLTE